MENPQASTGVKVWMVERIQFEQEDIEITEPKSHARLISLCALCCLLLMCLVSAGAGIIKTLPVAKNGFAVGAGGEAIEGRGVDVDGQRRNVAVAE